MLDWEIECTASCRRLVKRRRGLVETNPPRNSQLKLIEADGAGGGHRPAFSVVPNIGFDRFPMPAKLTEKAAAQRPPWLAWSVVPRTQPAAGSPALSADVSGYRPFRETSRWSSEPRSDPGIRCDPLLRISASS